MNTSSFWDDLEDKEFAHEYADEFLNAFIATQIKVLRGSLTQEQLAQKAGMAQERVSVLENVNYSSWSINTLRRLAKAFDLRLHVSFESFSTLISDMNSLNRVALYRNNRVEELKENTLRLNTVFESTAANPYEESKNKILMSAINPDTQQGGLGTFCMTQQEKNKTNIQHACI